MSSANQQVRPPNSNLVVTSPSRVPKTLRVLILVFVMILLVTLGLGGYYLFYEPRSQKIEERPFTKKTFILDPETGQTSGEKITTLKFVSEGIVIKQDLRNKENALFAKIYYINGVITDEEGKPREIKVVVQSTLGDTDKNAYYQFLQDIVEIKRLPVKVDETLLGEKDLETIFENGTSWSVGFYNKPLDLKSQFIDPSTEITQLILQAESSGHIEYESLNRFLNSGMTKNYKGFVFPDSLYPEDFR